VRKAGECEGSEMSEAITFTRVIEILIVIPAITDENLGVANRGREERA
jgi:hypothetical protein